MNIVLIGFGSRGDVQPFLALALALHERGHKVTLIAPNDFEAQIIAYGINFVPIPHSFKAILQLNVFEQVRREGVNPRAIIATLRYGSDQLKQMYRATVHIVAEIAKNADTIIC